ncbi:MAG: T9SS type A sorting domain-containing protein [Sphingobacteriaceae bacterium]|nr:T9SS type A sorting domain-containing protein [Sphingobacteriaceae bacterium]
MHFYIKDNDKPIPSPTNSITLNLLASFSNSLTGLNSAEIVAHDPTTQRLYIANSIGAKLDIVNFINPSAPSLFASISVTPYGNINSVAVRNGTVVCAIENSTNPQDSGKIVFFDKNGVFLKEVKAGMMPDMITFNQAGTKVLTANEGEPNQNYSVTATNDPDGSVTIVDISGGIPALTQANVAHVTFTVCNGQENVLRAQGIRIYGPHNMTSKDFEPEYISVSKDDSKAWITLQENNAIVEINMSTYAINYIKALGTKDYSLLNNGFDATNQTKAINISNFPIKGFYLPDAIASYTVGGINYLITANEGDSRDYTTFTEEKRVSALTLDPTMFPNGSELKNNFVVGRLNATNKNGDIDSDGDIDTIYCYGSRSFSIWNANTGNLVYDSKDDLEQITSSNSFSLIFNASNTTGVPTKKDRSDDKGPEPEGVTIGTIGVNTYAFIALERIGGVIVYDVTNPNAPVYVTYVNNRSLSAIGPDLGSEGLIFIPQSQSPNGQHIVIAANEISSTLSIWGIAGCINPVSTVVSMSGNSVSCSNQPPIISVPPGSGNYQWFNGSTPVSGATSNTFSPASSGNFSVQITNGPNCFAQSFSKSITINASPTLNISGSASIICVGDAATLTASGANGTYTWTGGSNSTSIAISPSVTTTYTLIGQNTNSCSSSAAYTQTVSTCTSLDEFTTGNGFILYPNPARSSIIIKTNSVELLDVKIFNAIGQLVLTENNYRSDKLIQISDLTKGLYFVSVKQGNNDVNIQKLIVY